MALPSGLDFPDPLLIASKQEVLEHGKHHLVEGTDAPGQGEGPREDVPPDAIAPNKPKQPHPSPYRDKSMDEISRMVSSATKTDNKGAPLM